MFSQFNFKKYRPLVISVLIFLAIDLGVLIFNVYATYQIERDTVRLIKAGEQTKLAESIAKSVFSLEQTKKDNLSLSNSLTELRQSVTAFDANDKQIKSDALDSPVFALFGLERYAVTNAANAVDPIWKELKTGLAPLIDSASVGAEFADISNAKTQVLSTNTRLQKALGDLVHETDEAAVIKAQSMRWVQLGAIAIALLNFLHILFRFLRQLNTADQAADTARQETTDILNTVNEGLMLIDSKGKIGSQMSGAVHELLGRTVQPNEDFRRLIGSLVSPERADEIEIYINLLFDPKVKPALLVQLDPMKEVEIISNSVSNSATALNGHRFLSFNLTQLRENNQINGLLVTAFDVTNKVKLERELSSSQSEAKADVEDLLRVFEQEPATMREFLSVTKQKLSQLNEAMRTVGKTPAAYKALLNSTANLIHGVKGESAALSLTGVSRQAHTMENGLTGLLRQTQVTGEDLIPVVYELSRVQEQVERIERLFQRIMGTERLASPIRAAVAPINTAAANKKLLDPPTQLMSEVPVLKQTVSAAQVLAQESGALSPITMMFAENVPPLEEMASNLNKLALKVGDSLDKKIAFKHTIDAVQPSAAMLRVLREVLPQLVRNSVVHGVEIPMERLSANKPVEGQLQLTIRKVSDSVNEVSLKDDGRGISVDTVRNRLQEMKVDISMLSNAQILAYIFEPQFSTARNVTEHGGRGVGLALVKDVLENAGARLKVNTCLGASTEFVIQFGAHL